MFYTRDNVDHSDITDDDNQNI